ncbi:glycosyltransferase [bacterium]|nr:glycosyltransferase [bacterium]MBU1024691.1 glycosyltransferase [bacterium]
MALKRDNIQQPEISVAVIAMNCREHVRRLVDSLKIPLNGISHEIVFVDNASTDGTVEMLKSDYSNIVLIENKRNNGVSLARNQALKNCRGKYIYIVDADCEYQEGDFKEATRYLEDNSHVGLLGFRMYYPSGDLQDSGRTLPTPIHLVFNRLEGSDRIRESITFRRHRMKDFDPMSLREAGFVSGASQFFKRELLNEIGFLDEKMFYGYEDSDFCARVIKSKKKVVYFPNIVFIHHHQRLTKKNPLSKMTLIQIKSYQIFLKKHAKDLARINRDLHQKNQPPSFTN